MNSYQLAFVFLFAFLIRESSQFSLGSWGRQEKGNEEINLSEAFLTKLGLSRVPNVTRARTTRAEMEQLLATYERSARGYELAQATDGSEFQRLQTYTDNAPKTEKKDTFLLSFDLNVGSTARGLMLHSAKLHIYKEQGQRSRRDNSATVELYQLLESSMLDSPQSLLIELRKVVFDTDDWEVFDVTKAVATWLEKPSTNHGFLIKCRECTSRMTLVTADTARDQENRALLDIVVVDSFSRLKRSNPFLMDTDEAEVNDCTKGSKENNLCCRYSMWISFKDMGWDWIVKPEGFHAYYCKGECPYDYINYANTHALLQSIYNSKYDKTIPPPCCVPKSLKPLSLLHYIDSDPPQLVVSRQTGMIAESCGCA